MLYFDTAYLVRCYVAEMGFEAVRDLAASQDCLVSCDLARVEFASAVQRKVREGWLTAHQVKVVWRQFERDVENGHVSWLPVSTNVLDDAIDRIQKNGKMPLRALDAIHLACARENGFYEIFSNDRHLLAAAPVFGLTPRNVLPMA